MYGFIRGFPFRDKFISTDVNGCPDNWVDKKSWGDRISDYVAQDGRKEAIEAIMTNRHKIAQGDGDDSNITISRAKEYLAKIVVVVEFMENQCS